MMLMSPSGSTSSSSSLASGGGSKRRRRGQARPQSYPAPGLLSLSSDIIRNLSTPELVSKMMMLLHDFLQTGRPCTTTERLLVESVKSIGLEIELDMKAELDEMFLVLREVLRKSNLDHFSRLSLLELFELRHYDWCQTENHSSYYRQRYSELECDGSEQRQKQHSSPQLLLDDREIVRPSGRYSKPAKIPNKNLYKDEIIIRASDSGKVMGVKGKRIKILEDASNTVISFQRASHGARERVIQIIGSLSSQIERAKELIEEAIRRNMSPTRSEVEKAIGDGGGVVCDKEDGASSRAPSLSSSDCSSLSGTVDDKSVRNQGTVTFQVPHTTLTVSAKTDLELEVAKHILTYLFAPNNSNSVAKQNIPSNSRSPVALEALQRLRALNIGSVPSRERGDDRGRLKTEREEFHFFRLNLNKLSFPSTTEVEKAEPKSKVKFFVEEEDGTGGGRGSPAVKPARLKSRSKTITDPTKVAIDLEKAKLMAEHMQMEHEKKLNISKDSRLKAKLGYVVKMVRQPIYPHSNRQAMLHAERGNDLATLSAKARRAQFAKTAEWYLLQESAKEQANRRAMAMEASLSGMIAELDAALGAIQTVTKEPKPRDTCDTSTQTCDLNTQHKAGSMCGKLVYTRDFLLNCSKMEASRHVPMEYSQLLEFEEIRRKDPAPFDADVFRSRARVDTVERYRRPLSCPGEEFLTTNNYLHLTPQPPVDPILFTEFYQPK